MTAPHIAFATSVVSNPSSHAVAHSTTGPLPLLPPASSPITVSNDILDSNSHSHAYYYSYNVPPDTSHATAVSRNLGSATSRDPAHIISAFASSALPASSASPVDAFAGSDAHPLSFRQRATPFSAASLPRTSSLLPPARVTAKTVPISNSNRAATANPSTATNNPLNAPTTIAPSSSTAEPPAFPSAIASPPDFSAAGPPSGHRPSRSNSVGIAPDPTRLLDRWSNSTGSSRTSAAGGHQLYHRHQRSASFSRRLSVDSLGSPLQLKEFEPSAPDPSAVQTSTASSGPIARQQTPQTQQTPRKLQKNRPSTSNTNSPLRESPGVRGARASRQLSPVRIAPFASLPPIIALPSLEQEVQGGTSSFSGRMTPQQRRPHIRQLSSEDNIQSFYFGDAPPPASTIPAYRTASAQAGRQDHSPIYNTPPREGTNHTTAAAMQYSREQPEAVQSSRGYTRNRSQAANGSTDSTKSTKDRGSKPPSQKAMLSRALQKANTAVQLDNAGNIEGARAAYIEACGLLQQVLAKTPGEEDKRKLEAIKITYTARIDELDQLAATQRQDARPLPRRPSSSSVRGRSNSGVNSDAGVEVDEDAIVETAQILRIHDDENHQPGPTEPRSVPSYSVPPATSSPRLIQSAFSNTTNEPPRHVSSLLSDQYTLQSTFSRSPRKEFSVPHNPNAMGPTSSLQPPPTANQYMPPPLSPRRMVPPPRPFEDAPPTYGYSGDEETLSSARYGSNLRPGSAAATGNDAATSHGHNRTGSHESVSWLDPINESGSSAASSVHSRSSSLGIRRKHIRAASGATEAEFDAALDDAIEAAYDDGYEPTSSNPIFQSAQDYKSYRNGEAQVSNSMRKVELAKERVRETEREAIAFERQLRLREQLMQRQEEEEEQIDRGMTRDFLDAGDESGDEEERILEGMTSGYAIEDFAFGLNQKAKLPPRESDSSEFTSRTWHSSMASNPPTATTVLSTVSESTVMPPSFSKGSTNTMPPPPTQALPQLPPQPPPQMPPPQIRQPPSQSPVRGGSAQSVRNRRLSGQNTMQLKIETTKLSPPSGSVGPATANNTSSSSHPSNSSLSASAAMPQQPRTAGFLVHQRQALSAGPSRPGSSAAGASVPFARQAPTPSPGAGATMFFGASPVEVMPPPNFPPPTPPIPQGLPFADNDSTAGRSGSPSTGRPGLRKNFSSSSLRSLRSRNMSVTNLDGGSDISPGTPLSNQFMLSNSRLPDVPSLPTPSATTFKDRMIIAASGVGGMHLLESDFHSPSTPGSPNPMYSDAPFPLEPCPTDTMLRPFWLMRCLYQTLVHPRGGYLSNKLFVPSDVWKVKGVRLKNLDEKISNCDFLTSALLKLAQVDTCDADAVLEEMQSLEGVLEQAQTVLTRKLGNDVGVQSANALFKDASTGVENDPAPGAVPRTSSVSGNSRSFSWRRLRSKNSSAGLSSSFNAAGRKESVSDGSGPKDGGALSSLPMTTQPTRRPAKRDVASAKFSGPNAIYMNALARLFDAAQSIDQIARQVEDPGLRHADKTQVGLELCTRHAAEFFAFYICRFVLSDVSLLLEKFIKRGSEWVLA